MLELLAVDELATEVERRVNEERAELGGRGGRFSIPRPLDTVSERARTYSVRNCSRASENGLAGVHVKREEARAATHDRLPGCFAGVARVSADQSKCRKVDAHRPGARGP